MAKDEVLNGALAKVAASSNGQITFASISSKELAEELHIDLGRTPNPIYSFKINPPAGESFQCLAYTLLVDGSKRPATRAEALGRGLRAGNGKLFELNPFLLIFDNVGQQFMAVSAVSLFAAFAKEASGLQKPDTAAFSLSPNFKNHTISMYADVPSASIWHSKLDGTLVPSTLLAGLTNIRNETKILAEEIPGIVKAIETRLANTQPLPTGPTALPEGSEVLHVPAPELPEASIQIDERVRRMARTALRSASAVVLVGPPGTGKTALLRELLREIALAPTEFGLETLRPPLWATPDESWTARDLVGGETIVGNEIQFRPGWVLKAISDNRWLVLDEVNRADMDRIFGGLLTWLSGGTVTLGSASTATNAPRIELAWNGSEIDCATEGIDASGNLVGTEGRVRYSAGAGWRLLGTYNALDAQRVFRFGAALGRRFVRVPIPAPSIELFTLALEEQAAQIPKGTRDGIRSLYSAHLETEETQLGPAIFLAMCKYIMAATTPDSNALSEAYVVHAGTWLAHLDQRDLDALGDRVLASNALAPDEWAWVKQMIRSLA